MSAGTAGGQWRDLSDGELVARLKQRGIQGLRALHLTSNREQIWADREITKALER